MGNNWKQAIFVGGAILILAACSDATAPQPSSLRTVGAMQSARVQPPKKSSPVVKPQDCRSGYSISVGFADTSSVGICLLR